MNKFWNISNFLDKVILRVLLIVKIWLLPFVSLLILLTFSKHILVVISWGVVEELGWVNHWHKI